MKIQIECPLCGSIKNKVLEEIRTEDLINLYQISLKINVSNLFKEKILFQIKCENCDLIFFNPNIIEDEKFYNKLQQFSWYYMENKEEFMFAKKNIKANDKVLEIGCGNGNFAKNIIPDNYMGLEFSEESVRKTRERGFSVENRSIEEFSVENGNQYDVVCSFQVLEHVSNVNSFIKSSIKCLKLGGTMIISVPSENSFLSLAPNNILNTPPHHVNRWSDSALYNIGNVFSDLKVECIHHEKVSEVHRKWFYDTLAYDMVRNFLNVKKKTINIVFSNKAVALLKIPISKIMSYVYELTDYSNGHTVTVILKKK